MPSERVQRRIDELLDQAEQAIRGLDWSRVRATSLSVLAADAENEDATTFLAMAEPHLGEVTSGIPTEPEPPIAPDPNAPTSFANGRYQVTRFLGEGGKKMVYLARDTNLDRDVAFGLIKAEGLDDESRQRITREAQAMARLGDHPNIMPIFELGDEGGQPYLVQPLMGGGDVEALIEDAGDGGLSIEHALQVASEICRGLEFAHSKGIIHRDLKPGNVWLTDDGVARIGDFGLAISLGRSRLTQEKMIVGTVSYMPPEQATGGEITPKADLYSLGAMLYEMITGRPPFMGDDDIAIISQHVNTPPVTPGWHNASIPQSLDSLIIRLLAKDPAERPESAQAVLTAIAAIDLSAESESDDAQARLLDSMTGGVFVGRNDEMDRLKAMVEDALSGTGRIATLVGEPGIGKTRTAQELATYASLRGAHVLWGRCYEERGAPPYCPWLQAIWECSKDLEAGELRAKLGAGAPEIADAIPYIRERLPDIPPAPILEPGPARYRFFDAVGQFLQRVSSDQPRLIILDDVHWADESSLLLLVHLAHMVSSSRLMVLMTYRDNELSLRHPLSRALADLQKQQSFERIWVRGLSHSAIARFIEISAGVEPPENLSRSVHVQTEGNPLFMTEVVRLLVEEGDISPDHVADRETWSVRIPEGVRVVVGTRLSKLTDEANKVLSAAAVIGREFDMGILMSVAGNLVPSSGDQSTDAFLVDTLENAVWAKVIEEIPGAPGRYRFSHSLIQQTLLEDVSAVRQMQLHASIATAIEERSGPEEIDALSIASHMADAGSLADPDKFARVSLIAGDVALERYAYEEAAEIFERALAAKEGLTPDSETAALLHGLGRSQAALMQQSDAAEALTRAFEIYLEAGDGTGATEVAATPVYSGETGVPDLLSRALELVAPDSREEAVILSQQALNIGNRGDYDGAIAAYGKALSIAEREGDQTLEMWTLARYGHTEFYYGRMEGCVQRDGRAVEMSREIGDPRAAAYAGYCLIFAFQGQGDHEGALKAANMRLSAAEEARHRSSLLTSLGVSAALAICRGEWNQALELIARGLELNESAMDLLAYRYVINLSVGESDSANDDWKRIRELIEDGTRVTISAKSALLFAALLSGNTNGLQSIQDSAISTMGRDGRLPLMTTEATLALCTIAVVEDDAETAGIYFSQLAEVALSNPMQYVLFMERVLGMTAALLGNEDDATHHFERALEFCRSAGYRPELAWSCAAYADLLLGRNQPDDPSTSSGQRREKATELQDEAIAIATDLGMKSLLERVLASREILKA